FGAVPVTVPLRTIRSSLTSVRLGDLLGAPGPLADVLMVPIVAPADSGLCADPVPAAAAERDLFRSAPEIAVRNVGDVFLQADELTFGEYRTIVRHGLRLADGRTEGLVHADDPLGAARLTAGGMAPRVTGRDAAPVAGIDWFQAFTAARLCGAIAGDPELFRLPFGRELEL